MFAILTYFHPSLLLHFHPSPQNEHPPPHEATTLYPMASSLIHPRFPISQEMPSSTSIHSPNSSPTIIPNHPSFEKQCHSPLHSPNSPEHSNDHHSNLLLQSVSLKNLQLHLLLNPTNLNEELLHTILSPFHEHFHHQLSHSPIHSNFKFLVFAIPTIFLQLYSLSTQQAQSPMLLYYHHHEYESV